MIIVNDLCFDISRINSSTYQVSDFVDSLIYQDEVEDRRVHRYEETLKYVEFPPLDMMEAGREPYKQNSYLRKDHEEVFRILDWLYSRGVRKIIKLKVPDRLVNPHDDVRMADYVERFEVEVLDWKVLDLSISVFKDRKHELEEIRLYSSGRRSVIDHWFNKDDGVESLPKVSAHCYWYLSETRPKFPPWPQYGFAILRLSRNLLQVCSILTDNADYNLNYELLAQEASLSSHSG